MWKRERFDGGVHQAQSMWEMCEKELQKSSEGEINVTRLQKI